MRFTFSSAMATRFATTMVATARPKTRPAHVSYSPPNAVRKTRRKAANAAAFTAAAMKPVTGAGAPS